MNTSGASPMTHLPSGVKLSGELSKCGVGTLANAGSLCTALSQRGSAQTTKGKYHSFVHCACTKFYQI